MCSFFELFHCPCFLIFILLSFTGHPRSTQRGFLWVLFNHCFYMFWLFSFSFWLLGDIFYFNFQLLDFFILDILWWLIPKSSFLPSDHCVGSVFTRVVLLDIFWFSNKWWEKPGKVWDWVSWKPGFHLHGLNEWQRVNTPEDRIRKRKQKESQFNSHPWLLCLFSFFDFLYNSFFYFNLTWDVFLKNPTNIHGTRLWGLLS